MTTRDELKPCSFCGGAAMMLKDHKRLGFYIGCTLCHACGTTGLKPEVLKRWNARALTASAPKGEQTPAAEWDEAMSNCDDFLADIVGGAQVTERSVQHAKELREGIAALRREAPASSGVAEPLAGISTGQLFNTLLSRINFDGMDPRTFSLAELQRSIDGAEWPK